MTRKADPFYQHNDKGEIVQYAVCPDCNNPIQIIGLYTKLKNTDHPYGKHCTRSIRDIADYNAQAFEYCSLANPNRSLNKDMKRKSKGEKGEQIISIIRNYFDQIAFIFSKFTGIYMSRGLAVRMLKKYKSSEGYLYFGANSMNVPWIFAYMANNHSLFGQKIVDDTLRELIKKNCQNIYFEGEWIRTKKYTDIEFWFTKHRQTMTPENGLSESMELKLTYNGKTFFSKKIDFDHDYFQNLMNYSDDCRTRKKELTDKAKEFFPAAD
ncbi:conserved protein of unknown function [Maridesulfovibrio hydrothermalis AM13 = DSM 14728]|uniref:Uncharacterized protein n=2 Tax=Maridesulfovibrio hydrothermalis AM13 = DSM 14728 TaxID=1121451 RepID=L0RES2_9BACT|nr:conserved protein of unknown function [Maridesulfovibrio hydrothermalis AM13 = DSM 14728]